MTQERDEFEKFVRRCNGSWADKCLTKLPDGRYNVLQTASDWAAWQACWLIRDGIDTANVTPGIDLSKLDHRSLKLWNMSLSDTGERLVRLSDLLAQKHKIKEKME